MTQHDSDITNRHRQPVRFSHGRGFTLIELTLVIVVIATLMLIAAQVYKQQRESLAVKQTAVEMQQIVQAAQAYYVSDANNYWPTSINQLNGIKHCGSLFLNTGGSCSGFNSYTLSFPAGYVAQGSANMGQGGGNDPLDLFGPVCPVGKPSLNCYCPRGQLDIRCLCPDAGYPGHACTRGAPPSPASKKASTIIVSTTVPNSNVAKQLAGLLPMAKVNGDTVSMTMPAPTETPMDYTLEDLMNEQEVIMIKSVYTTLIGAGNMTNKALSADTRFKNTSNSSLVTLPACPIGWTPGYDAALTQTLVNTNGQNIIRGVYLCRQNYIFQPSQDGKSPGSDIIQVKSDRKSGSDYYSALVLIVTYCVPPKAIADNVNLKNRFTAYTKIVVGNPDKCRFANFSGSGG